MSSGSQFDSFVDAVSEGSRGKQKTLAVVANHWSCYLDAGLDAVDQDWVKIRVIGPDSFKDECVSRFGKLSHSLKFYSMSDPQEQINLLRNWCAGSKTDAMLLGDMTDHQVQRLFSTADPCSTLEEGITRACLLSIPTYPKLLTVIGPFGPEKTTFDTMVQQMKYGYHLMRGIGICEPQVALLSAKDKVGVDDIHTYNCRCLISMVKLDQIPSLKLEGPLSFDTAVDPGTVAHLGWQGPVAGQADVLVVDSRQTRSVIALTLTEFGDAKAVRLIFGGRIPMLILNEGSTEEDGRNGIAVALKLSPYMKTTEPLDWLTHPEPIDYTW